MSRCTANTGGEYARMSTFIKSSSDIADGLSAEEVSQGDIDEVEQLKSDATDLVDKLDTVAETMRENLAEQGEDEEPDDDEEEVEEEKTT